MHENDVQSIFYHSYDPPKPGGEMANCDLFGVKIAKNDCSQLWAEKFGLTNFDPIFFDLKAILVKYFLSWATLISWQLWPGTHFDLRIFVLNNFDLMTTLISWQLWSCDNWSEVDFNSSQNSVLFKSGFSHFEGEGKSLVINKQMRKIEIATKLLDIIRTITDASAIVLIIKGLKLSK